MNPMQILPVTLLCQLVWFNLSCGNPLLSQTNHGATEKQKLEGASRAGTSGGGLSNPCSMQVQLDWVALGPAQSRLDYVPGQRSHSFSGPLFQYLTIIIGNIFFLRFNYNFSSFILCPLPLVLPLPTSDRSLVLSTALL